MKTVFLVRHGESEYPNGAMGDKERKLLPVGIHNTMKVGKHLSGHNVRPGLILCSPAERALQTAQILAKELNCTESQLKVDKRIYSSMPNTLIDILLEQDDSLSSLMLVGHNPEFTILASAFMDEALDWMPTSGVFAFHFHSDEWNQLPLAKRSTHLVITPDEL